MILNIIDVEHGACALITTSNGKRVMIDCGSNSTTGWQPGNTLVAKGIYTLDRLFITNYDEDHVSGFPNLMDNVNVTALTRNWHINPNTIRFLKSENGMGAGIDRLVKALESHFTGTVPATFDTSFGDTSFEIFANPYGSPPQGFDDENNLSLVVFVTCGAHRLIFPGDLEKAGWEVMLKNSQFVEMLRGVTLFVASHHGRENGYCEEAFNYCQNVQLVIMSDKAKQHETQETVPLYQKHVSGAVYNGQTRYVLTTRNDGHMKFDLNASGVGSFHLQLAA
jgi:beta-lactamase superfamily II metal-dependent hydrolase